MVKDQKNKPKDDLCLQQIEFFIRYLRLEKNYAENTVSAYQGDLRKLMRFVKSRDIAQWSDVDEKMLNYRY